MMKVVVLYGTPTDPSAFEDHYANTHLPLVSKMPNIQRVESTRFVGMPDGGELPYYGMTELWFDSEQSLKATMSSSEGQETAADTENFATGGATVLISRVD